MDLATWRKRKLGGCHRSRGRGRGRGRGRIGRRKGQLQAEWVVCSLPSRSRIEADGCVSRQRICDVGLHLGLVIAVQMMRMSGQGDPGSPRRKKLNLTVSMRSCFDDVVGYLSEREA